MKEMSVEDLLKIVCFDKDIIKVRQAHAELLRRFEELDKQAINWAKIAGNWAKIAGWHQKQIVKLVNEIENLKCCGNCKLGYTLECPMWKVYKEKGDDYPSECGYCDRWQSDGLSREEREGK